MCEVQPGQCQPGLAWLWVRGATEGICGHSRRPQWQSCGSQAARKLSLSASHLTLPVLHNLVVGSLGLNSLDCGSEVRHSL